MAIAEGITGRASAAGFSRARRRLGAALVALALVSLAPRPARAQLREVVMVFVFVAATVIVVDSVFFVHDAGVMVQKEHPSTAFSVAEVIVMAPQAIGFNIANAANMTDDGGDAWAVLPAMLTSAMLAHGIWSFTEDPEAPNPYTRFLGSGAVGVNGTLTVGALAALSSERRVFTRPMGVAEVALTLPQVVVGAVGLANDDAANRPAWGALTAWSGALLAHGVASIALGGEEDPKETSRRARTSKRRAGAIDPRIRGMGPAPLGGFDGHAPGMGFMLQGSF